MARIKVGDSVGTHITEIRGYWVGNIKYTDDEGTKSFQVTREDKCRTPTQAMEEMVRWLRSQ